MTLGATCHSSCTPRTPPGRSVPTRLTLHPARVVLGVALLLGTPAQPLSAQLVTDRPDFVESSTTVGAGVIQVETGVAYSRSGSGASKDAAWTTPSLLRIGIGSVLELRLESELARVDASAPGAGAGSGVSDVSLGLKWHAAGPVGLRPSIGVLVHVDLPSGSPRLRGTGARPSLRLSAEWELAGGVGLGIMPGIVYDSGAAGRYAAGIFGLVAGRELASRFRGFLELSFERVAAAHHGGSVGAWGTGVTHMVNRDLQVDIAVSAPVTSAAPDWSITLGVSRRFGAR